MHSCFILGGRDGYAGVISATTHLASPEVGLWVQLTGSIRAAAVPGRPGAFWPYRAAKAQFHQLQPTRQISTEAPVPAHPVVFP